MDLSKEYLRFLRKIHPTTFVSQMGMDELAFSGLMHILQNKVPKSKLIKFRKSPDAQIIVRNYHQYVLHMLKKARLSPIEVELLRPHIESLATDVKPEASGFWNIEQLFNLYTMDSKSDWRQVFDRNIKHVPVSIRQTLLHLDILAALAYHQRPLIKGICDALDIGVHVDWNLTDHLCNWNTSTEKPLRPDEPYAKEECTSGRTTTRMLTVFRDVKNKHLVVAFRGTDFKNTGDVISDWGIFMGNTHSYPRFEMAARVITQLVQIEPDYTISTCGHSLGGALSIFGFLFIPDGHRGSCIGFNAGNGIANVLDVAEQFFSQKDYNAYKVRGNFCFDLANVCENDNACNLEPYTSCICKQVSCPSPLQLRQRFREAFVVRHVADIISLGWKEHTDIRVINIGRTKYTPFYYGSNILSALTYHSMNCFVKPHIAQAMAIAMQHHTIKTGSKLTREVVYSNNKVCTASDLPPPSDITLYKSFQNMIKIIPTKAIACAKMVKSSSVNSIAFARFLWNVLHRIEGKEEIFESAASSSIVSDQDVMGNINGLVCDVLKKYIDSNKVVPLPMSTSAAPNSTSYKSPIHVPQTRKRATRISQLQTIPENNHVKPKSTRNVKRARKTAKSQ
jgi:hypothetical protein